MKRLKMTKRLWSLYDLAEFLYGSREHRFYSRARRLIRNLEQRNGVRLLYCTSGGRMNHRIRPAALKRLDPDLFETLDSPEARIESLEEQVADLQMMVEELEKRDHTIARVVASNSRAMVRLQASTSRRVA